MRCAISQISAYLIYFAAEAWNYSNSPLLRFICEALLKMSVMQHINISHFSLQYLPGFRESIVITLSKVHAHGHLSWEPFGWNLHFGVNHVELLLYAEVCCVCDGGNSNHVFLAYYAVQFCRWVIVSWVTTASIFYRESEGNLLPRNFATYPTSYKVPCCRSVTVLIFTLFIV